MSVSTPAGLPASFSVNGTISSDISGVVNVLIVDRDGVIHPNVSISQLSGRTYRATLTIPPTLEPGTYTGTLGIRLCGGTPPACSPEHASANLPYEFRIGTDPVPVISSLSPNQRLSGSGSVLVTISGSNFWPGAVVTVNGATRSTTYQSPTSVRTTLTADDIRFSGVLQVAVVNPEGNASEPSPFTVLNRVPELRGLGPTTTTAGCGDFSLQVRGVDFVAGAQVFLNTTPLSTFPIFESELLLALVPAELVTSPGEALITVRNPLPGGGASLARAFTINGGTVQSSPATAYRNDAARSGVAAVRCPNVVGPGGSWAAGVGGSASYALVANERVIVTVLEGGGTSLLALQQANGQPAWGPLAVGASGYAAWDDDILYVAATSDPVLPPLAGGGQPASLQAYIASTGALLWRAAIPADFPVTRLSPPAAAGGRVFINFSDGLQQHRLGAFSQADGSLLWQQAAPSAASPPAVAGTAVFVGSSCLTRAHAADSGTILWAQGDDCPDPEGRRVSVVGEIVYAGRKGAVLPYYAAASGAQLGSYVGGRELIVAGDRGFLATDQGRVAGIDLSGGAILWDAAFSSTEGVAPLFAGGVVYAPYTLGAAVSGFDAVTGRPLWTLPAAGIVADPFAAGGQARGLSTGGDLLVIPAGNGVIAYRLGNPD